MTVEELTDGGSEWLTPCPWPESGQDQGHLLVIHAQVADLERARNTLVQVLGAKESAVPGDSGRHL
ncbi:hypothetical protein [Arthrobacter psychrolactophilus]